MNKWIPILILALLSYTTHSAYHYGLIDLPPDSWGFLLKTLTFVLIVYSCMLLLVEMADKTDVTTWGSEVSWTKPMKVGLPFVAVSMVQLAIAQFVVVADKNGWMEGAFVLLYSYPLLAVSMAVHVVLGKGLGHHLDDQRAAVVQVTCELWKRYHEPRFLLAVLRARLPALQGADKDSVRFFDWVIAVPKNKKTLAYLTDGSAVVFNFPISALKRSPLSAWMVKTNTRSVVNMLYSTSTVESLRLTKHIALDEDVQRVLSTSLGRQALAQMLAVSRHCENGTTLFLENMDKLEIYGWEQPLLSCARQKSKL